MNLLSRLRGGGAELERQLSLDEYAALLSQFTYDGLAYSTGGMQQTLVGTGTERPADNFQGLTRQAYQSNGVVFACVLARMLVFSSIRFQWQNLRNGSPSDTFGNKDLAILEEPWIGGTTQDMLVRMIQDADLAGNSYWVREQNGTEMVRLRPDWVMIVGEKRYMNTTTRSASRGGGQVGWKKRGYLYTEGGLTPGNPNESVAFSVDEVAHFAPNPDPLAVFTGMSWLTPILRDIQNDHAMSRHQRRFMDNGATPSIVVKHFGGAPGIAAATQAGVRKWVEEFQDQHTGVENAGKTLHLYPGADIEVVGANLKEIDFSEIRDGGETRIAAAAGVPPVIAGLSKGLESSTYSNYSQARRRFADGTIHPLWQNAAGSLQQVMPRPGSGIRLWYDTTGVPFLREDEKDAAAIAAIKAATINSYITAGYKPDSVIAAVESDDLRLLVHSGLYSVQLQQPGADLANTVTDPAVAGRNGQPVLDQVNRVLELLAVPATTEEDQ